MFCIYCGSQTDNESKICNACAASRESAVPEMPVEQEAPAVQETPVELETPVEPETPVTPVNNSPFQPEAPLMTEAPENLSLNEQPPFQPEMLVAPTYAEQPAPTYGAQAQPTYGSQPQPTYGTPLQPTYGAQPQPTYGTPIQPTYGAQPQPTYGTPGQPTYGAVGGYQWQGNPQTQQGMTPPPVQSQMLVRETSKQALALKEAMASFPAMMAAISLSVVALFSIISFIVTSGSYGVITIFTIGVPQLLLVAGAWISYLSAKGNREVPITAGLKMVSAVSIIYLVMIACGIVVFFVCLCIIAAAGSALALSGMNLDDLLGSGFAAIANASLGVIIGIILLCIVAMVLCIVFCATCNKNIGIMRNVLTGRTKQVKFVFFPIIWCYVIAACNIIGIVNYVDILISGKTFSQLTGLPNTSPAVAVVGILVCIGNIAAGVFGSRAMSRCRKDLLNAE